MTDYFPSGREHLRAVSLERENGGECGFYMLSCRIHRALRATFQGMVLLEENFS